MILLTCTTNYLNSEESAAILPRVPGFCKLYVSLSFSLLITTSFQAYYKILKLKKAQLKGLNFDGVGNKHFNIKFTRVLFVKEITEEISVGVR